MTLSIRPAEPGDSTAIADVNLASWRAGYEALLPHQVLSALIQEDLTARWQQELARMEAGEAEVLVAEIDDRVVAYSRFGPSRDEDSILAGGTAELYGFYVRPDRWGTGVAATLMEHVIDRLRAEGYAHVTLNVVEDNARARSFYERQGFAPDVPAAPWHGVAQVRYRREAHAR